MSIASLTYDLTVFSGEIEGTLHYQLVECFSDLSSARQAAESLERQGEKVVIKHNHQIVYESGYTLKDEITILERRQPGMLHDLKATLKDIVQQFRKSFRL